MLRERRTPWPRSIDVRLQRPPALAGDAATITFIGHATFLIQTPVGNLLTDPMYSVHAGPMRVFGPRRVRQPAIRFEDLALLPIGAYEPRWFMRAVHMNPAEAVQAHLDLGASQSIGMHFGTFPMTTAGIDEPTRALKDACRAKNLPFNSFRTLDFGESARITAQIP